MTGGDRLDRHTRVLQKMFGGHKRVFSASLFVVLYTSAMCVCDATAVDLKKNKIITATDDRGTTTKLSSYCFAVPFIRRRRYDYYYVCVCTCNIPSRVRRRDDDNSQKTAAAATCTVCDAIDDTL